MCSAAEEASPGARRPSSIGNFPADVEEANAVLLTERACDECVRLADLGALNRAVLVFTNLLVMYGNAEMHRVTSTAESAAGFFDLIIASKILD